MSDGPGVETAMTLSLSPSRREPSDPVLTRRAKASGTPANDADSGEDDMAGPPEFKNAALALRGDFRGAMRLLASTVALVTCAHGERRGGLTATAACSLSLDPPMMVVCVNRRSNTHQLIRRSGSFCVNYLAEHHEELATLFAHTLDDAEAKFARGGWAKSPLGNPALLDSLAVVECNVHRRVDEGTHSVFIGKVASATADSTAQPLVYSRGGFAHLTAEG